MCLCLTTSDKVKIEAIYYHKKYSKSHYISFKYKLINLEISSSSESSLPLNEYFSLKQILPKQANTDKMFRKKLNLWVTYVPSNYIALFKMVNTPIVDCKLKTKHFVKNSKGRLQKKPVKLVTLSKKGGRGQENG